MRPGAAGIRVHTDKAAFRGQLVECPQHLTPKIAIMKIVHVINDLDIGGAETMLCRLLSVGGSTVRHGAVVSMLPPGVLKPRIDEIGVPVHSLDFGRGLPKPRAFGRFWSTFRGLSGDLMQGWMYHGNLAATLGARIAKGRQPVIWNIRHSLHDISKEKPGTAALIRLGARLSRIPGAIIYNSVTSARQHEALGYATARTRIIPNGLDCEEFKPRPERKARIRQEIGCSATGVVMGMIARNHPMKNTEGLLEALMTLTSGGSDLHLVLVGPGHDGSTEPLATRIRDLGLHDRITLLGARDDIATLMAALDFLVLPSTWGEGFPNVLAEAMASGLPCVATDVGDSALVVDKHGIIVPAEDKNALLAAIKSLANLSADERDTLGRGARAWIRDEFSIEEVGRRYEALYAEILKADLPATRSEPLRTKRAG